MRSLVIWGCGGHGRVVLDIATAMSVYDHILFYDDNPDAPATVSGVRVVSGGISDVRAAMPSTVIEFVIAIGANKTRSARFAEAAAAGLRPATCAHPTAWISASASIGAGSVLMPRAVVQAGASLGFDCIVNTGTIVEHDCVIGDHVHLSPAVTLGGGVRIEDYVHLGIGSIAIPGAWVRRASVVGAGAVVLGEIQPETTVVGIPARPIEKRVKSVG
jgi:sugar O-acyltransferase (sialic acid O-acetyltransferase NeuD family)